MIKNQLKSILTKFFPKVFPAYKNPFMFISQLPITSIVDVGANIGQFAHEIRHVFPVLPLHSCEPIKENFDQLKGSFIKDNNFIAYHIGCGAQQEQKEIYINIYSPSSSLLHTTQLHDQSFGHTRENGVRELINIDTLDHFTEDKVLGSEVLLKIDVQGYEDFVIKGGELFIKQHVAAIIIEMSFVELYEGQAGFEVLHEKLVSMGFVYKGPLSIKKGSLGEPLFDDSFYVHKRHI